MWAILGSIAMFVTANYDYKKLKNWAFPALCFSVLLLLLVLVPGIGRKINEARSEGVPICSCDSGYYYSSDKAEILKTVESLMHRTMAIEKAVSGLVKAVKEGVMENGI